MILCLGNFRVWGSDPMETCSDNHAAPNGVSPGQGGSVGRCGSSIRASPPLPLPPLPWKGLSGVEVQGHGAERLI